MNRESFRSSFLFGCLCAASALAAQPMRYFVTPLEMPGVDATRLASVTLTDSGQIVGHLFDATVGSSPTYQTKQIVTWTRSNPTIPSQLTSHVITHPLEVSETYGPGATDISEDGRIVAQFTSLGSTTASMWTWTPALPNGDTGSWTFVPPSAGSFSWKLGASISTNGDVCATPGNGTPMRLVPAGGGFDLQPLATFGGYTNANDMNNAGRAVGTSTYPSGAWHAYISQPRHDGTGILDLHSTVSGFASSTAEAVSDAGIVVGTAYTGLPRTNVLWTPTSPDGDSFTSMQIAPPGAYVSDGIPQDVNDRGEFVGEFIDRVLPSYSYVWSRESGYRDLNSLLESTSGADFRMKHALSINNAGQILAEASFDHDNDPSTFARRRSVLLTPGIAGDANFDMIVNFDDLLTLAQHYGSGAGQTWLTGDFTGNAGVDVDDLLALAQNYGISLIDSDAGQGDVNTFGVAFAANWRLARSLVPEPALLTTLCPVLLARRRRSDR